MHSYRARSHRFGLISRRTETLTNLHIYSKGSIQKEGKGMLQVSLSTSTLEFCNFLVIAGIIYINQIPQ